MQIVAAILAIAGIVMMTYADGFHSHSVIGIALVVGSASMSALYKVSACRISSLGWPITFGASLMAPVLSDEQLFSACRQICRDEACTCSWLWLSRPFQQWPSLYGIGDEIGGRVDG